jgi:hypothetical protein
MPYFEAVADGRFRPTGHTTGAWNTDEQHIAPALGLLVHLVETDRDRRRDDGLRVGRLAFEILGTIPMDVVDTEVRVVRPGRTIELVEATLSNGGRVAVVLRAWLVQSTDTGAIATPPGDRVPPPETLAAWDATSVWAGGLLASVEVRRAAPAPGRAVAWIRTPVPLLDAGEPSGLACAAGLFDLANAIALPVDPRQVAFPNVDLTAHVFREPRAGWIGFDTSASIGTDGRGVNTSTVHDLDGPFGIVTQSLTVRPIS